MDDTLTRSARHMKIVGPFGAQIKGICVNKLFNGFYSKLYFKKIY